LAVSFSFFFFFFFFSLAIIFNKVYLKQTYTDNMSVEELL